MSAAPGREPDSRRLTGSQQRMLLGAVAALVAVVLVVVLAGGGGDEDGGGSGGEDIELADVGLSLTAPANWQRDVTETSVDLRSPDETVVLSISSPVEGREPSRVKEALQDQLRDQLAPAKITKEGPGRLGERQVASFELSGELAGRPVTAVGLVEDTPFRTYAVTLVTGSPSAEAVQQARDILRSVELSEPEGAPEGGGDGSAAR